MSQSHKVESIISFLSVITKKTPLLLICIFVFNLASLLAQPGSESFGYLSVEDGLSNATKSCFLQDRKGFLWIGTPDGLNKYDGQNITVYRYKHTDPKSIGLNEILQLYEDKDGFIWIINDADKGISKYNPETESFTTFVHDPENPNSISSNTFYHIMQDKDSTLWFCTDSTIDFLEKNPVHNDQKLFKHIYVSNVKGRLAWIHENRFGDILVFTQKVHKINKEDCSLTTISDSILPLTAPYNITSLIEDEDGNILFGSGVAGNIKLNYQKESGRYIQDLNNNLNVSPQERNYVIKDNDNKIWIATGSKGLFLFDPEKKQSYNYTHNKLKENSLSENTLYSLYIDRSNILWIGTYSSGLCKYNLFKKQFYQYTKDPSNEISLSGNVISAISSTTPDELWVGLNREGGVNRIISENGIAKQIIKYKHNPANSNSLRNNSTFCLVQRKNGEVWLGSSQGYITVIYPEKPGSGEKPKFKNYQLSPWTFTILEDSNGTIWGGTWDSGLWRYHEETDSFKFFDHDPSNNSSIVDNIIWALYEDNKGNIWIGGRGKGLGILHASEKNKMNPKFINYKSNDKDTTSLSSNSINCFYQDSEGNMWIGTHYGLNKVDRRILKANNIQNLIFQSFHTYNGLPNEGIIGIVEDNHQNLWLSTSNSICRFNPSNNKLENYTTDHGLVNNQFRHNAFFRDEKGKIYFGGEGGIDAFYPDSIKNNPYIPEVVITSIKIFNKTVHVGEKINDEIILTKSITETPEIRLSYKNKVITFEFAALHYANPEKNQFAYTMENFDDDWNFVGNKTDATYTNMDAGEYIFRVKASNNDGIWNEEGTSIKIIITPPFWKTWWFIVTSILGLITLIVSIYFYRIHSITLQKIALEETVKSRTLEIQEKTEEIITQKEEIEKHRNNLEELVKERTQRLEEALIKAKESDELKSAFLANMSHEIRTPMNAIAGFSDLLNEVDLTPKERTEYVEIIQSNTSGLIKIIDEIIDLSIIESNQLKLTNELFDLNILIDHIYSYYSLSNKKSNLRIIKNNQLEKLNLKLNSDSLRIRQIINNLMDNAFKFTLEGHIELGTYIKNQILYIYVADTGIGIPSTKMDLIFQQFTKVEDSELEWTKGLGLGLAISQKIADAMSAKIDVKSEKGKGSTFSFGIPMEKVTTHDNTEIAVPLTPLLNNWTGKTILIAEDVDANFIYLEKALQKTGINVIRAKTGIEVLDLVLDNQTFDLILMDIKMPLMDGYEAAKKIKALNPKQIIVAQTAYSRPNEKRRFYDENFNEYLSKPISRADLIMILEKFL
ncbi:MAG: response regulator [Bacteroidales bacterium]|nr:response regulator [Bacteroidales bacterium]MBN2820987.1 response regulator [Bacteroidales bacterium]